VSEVWEANIEQKKFGPAFKKDSKAIQEVILQMSQMELESCKNVLEQEGKAEINMNGAEYVVTSDLMKIERVVKKETSQPSISCADSSLRVYSQCYRTFLRDRADSLFVDRTLLLA
jgi:glycyl-tRNA synthetase (class II)